MESKLYLIDGSAYIFRAFYGVRHGLTSPTGMPTNAVFGFKNMLLGLLKKYNPSHMVMVFDTPGPCFRNHLYPEYKANRSSPPDELKSQFDPIFELVEKLQIPIVTHQDFEADDVIATLAERFAPEMPVVVVTGDKDLAQLVTDQVTMYDSMKDHVYTEEGVKEKWGVLPEMMHEYLALVGDSADNIPGATGIGPKTALTLFEKFGDIKGIYQNLESLKGKQKENLANSKEAVDMSLALTVVQRDVPLDVDLDSFVRQSPDYPALKSFYEEMGFRSDGFFALGSAIEGNKEEKAAPADDWDYSRYQLVDSLEKLTLLVEALKPVERIALDFETTSLAAEQAKIVGISLAFAGGNPVYIPCAHQTEANQVEVPAALEALSPLFEDPNKQWVAQNVKYELMVLKNYQIEIKGTLHDSMIASYLLDVDAHRHNLDELSRLHLNHEMIHFEDLCGKGKSQIPFAQVPLDKALNYGAEDAEAALLIFAKLEKRLHDEGLWDLYQDMEMPLARCLAKVEHIGVKINTERLLEIRDSLQLSLVELEQRIYDLATHPFNINSPRQLGQVLFEELGIEEGKKKTKTGFSTDASVLERLAPSYEIAAQVLEYRGKTKLINTYLDPLPTLINPFDHRVHTQLSQTTAATGRLSSKNPNLQNIPIKGEDGKRIRSAFIPEEGNVMISADYSQVELRFLAHLSGDKALTEVFLSNQDIHRETAAAIFNITAEQVTGDQRRAAKAINFGIIYGMGAFRLAKEIKVSNREAKAFIEAYFERFSGIQSYMDETLEFAREKGYVETMFGRRRPIFEINSKNHLARTGAERAAINSRIQGSAADLIKRAMIHTQSAIEQGSLEAAMILQVHDELLFEVKAGSEQTEMPKIKELMESAASLQVPLLVEAGVGPDWGHAH